MFLELVSIIINCIFFSSLLLPYHVSHASLRRVGKLCRWHVALNIATARIMGYYYRIPFVKVARE
jgi:hypothetical protein